MSYFVYQRLQLIIALSRANMHLYTIHEASVEDFLRQRHVATCMFIQCFDKCVRHKFVPYSDLRPSQGFGRTGENSIYFRTRLIKMDTEQRQYLGAGDTKNH